MKSVSRIKTLLEVRKVIDELVWKERRSLAAKALKAVAASRSLNYARDCVSRYGFHSISEIPSKDLPKFTRDLRRDIGLGSSGRVSRASAMSRRLSEKSK